MTEFIDKTPEKAGTPINRKNLMAIQGFESIETTFEDENTIIERNLLGHTKTTRLNNDGSVTVVFVGEKTITKTMNFDKNGNCSEVLS